MHVPVFVPPPGPGIPAIVPTIAVDDPRLPGYTTLDVHKYFESHLPSWFEARPGPAYWFFEGVRFTTSIEFGQRRHPVHNWDHVTDPGRLVCCASLRGNFRITGPTSLIGDYEMTNDDIVQLMWDGCTGNYLLAALNDSLIETTQPNRS